MIKLKIENYLENHRFLYNKGINFDFKKYSLEEIIDGDLEKIKDGRIYEFNNLKEVKEFIDSCEIDFTEEYQKHWDEWEWEELDLTLDISNEEDNLLIYEINAHWDCRD